MAELQQSPSLNPPSGSAAPPGRRPTLGAPAGQIRQTFENRLVLDHLDLAEALAARFAGRGREREDLIQVAYLGLIKAARGFDDNRGVSFTAYAAPTVTGELKRYLRDRCWVVRPPRRIQDLRTELLRSEPELAQSLGHRPTAAELARELGVPETVVREAAAAGSSLRPDSLDIIDTNGDGRPALAESLASPDLPLERLEELMCLDQAIQELSEDDRELLYRRYFCEESQAELGRRFGVSQMQVSRRLSKVLVRLQQLLSAADAQSDPGVRTASVTS
ncbi:MAG: polymerase sigma-B factor [Arthrobacter sp.]|nr:polymerase sigma-B factor [Arthrobacter sp.]MCU1540077.1 polymerase sigma-B factor [Arthrobacter sp.]